MAASDNPNQTSPKVVAGGLVGVILAALAAGGAVLTPDQFAAFGPWAPFVFVVVTTLLIGGVAWWKTDPLRLNTLTQATAIAQDLVRQGAVVPEPAEPERQGRYEADPAVKQWPDNRG